MWRRILTRLISVCAIVYILGCILLYFNQESILFHPKKLALRHQLFFSQPFKELTFEARDHHQLNGVLFHQESIKQPLIFFLHGNTGNIENMEGISSFYTQQGYDFFAFDYRGFGKSDGTITGEDQFYNDARIVYREMTKRYPEKEITIIGYSVGTATATMLASENHPRQLVLMAPYYSMEDMAEYKYPFVPSFLVSYKFETFRFLKRVNAPVYIFHGKNDGTIPFRASKQLAGLLKPEDRFIPLSDIGHNNLENHPVFRNTIGYILRY